MSFRRNKSITAKELVEVRDIESRDAEYITWKRDIIFRTSKQPIFGVRNSGISVSRGTILVLGNAYGIMSYQPSIASAFATAGYHAYWFPFGGQPQSYAGQFSLRTASTEVENVIQRLREDAVESGSGIHVIAHCVSGLVLMEYLRRAPKPLVDTVVFYGLLAAPERLRRRAEPRLVAAGVETALTEWDWHYSAEGVAAELPDRPMLFCYVDDEINRRRCTLPELQRIASRTAQGRLQQFTSGYDENLTNLPTFVTAYTQWLTTTQTTLPE